MTKRLVLVSVAAMALVALFAISLFAATPVLYTKEQATGSALHYNPLGFQAEPRGGTVPMLPLMADLLQGTDTVVLKIRSGDLASAERELGRIAAQADRFESLVIRVEVDESALGAYVNVNRENIADLTDLLQQVRALDILDETSGNASITDQYRSAKWKALRTSMEETYRQYSSRQETVLDLSRQFGIDSSAYRSSILEFTNILAGVDDEQPAFPPGYTSRARLTLAAEPAALAYGERLAVQGVLSGISANSSVIDILVDGEPWGTVYPDEQGRYAWTAQIGQTRAGNHTVHAAWGDVVSDSAIFSIVPQSPLIELEAVPEITANASLIACSGILTANGTPVAGAPVRISMDGNLSATAYTTTNGTYQYRLPAQPGTHAVYASFSDTSFPLNPTATALATVTVPEPFPLQALLAALVAFSLVLAGAFVYLRYGDLLRSGIRSPAAVPQAAAPRPVAAAVHEEEWRMPPALLLREYHDAVGKGGPGALHLLYEDIAARLAAAFTIVRIRTLTPTEVFRQLPRSSVSANFFLFIRLHELVHYGGEWLPRDELAKAASLYTAIVASLRGEDH